MLRGHRRERAATRRAVLCAALVTGLLGVAVSTPGAAAPAAPAARDDVGTDLYLVTLDGPGAAATEGYVARSFAVLRAVQQQHDVLEDLGAASPVYRWTEALNGFAVELTAEQAATVAALPQVESVETDEVRPLAAAAEGSAASRTVRGPRRGGGGVVIGVVDTGLAPDSPSFAQRTLRQEPDGFTGGCETASDWAEAECNAKVVGARWYVEGFGEDAVRAASSFSPRDSDGHGTQMASLAAGNPDTPVSVGGERLGRFGGTAPDARVAVYKACWSAPDPADDGCSTADLVTAIDDATRDGVDVLSLAVGGPAGVDTVERALLGATESGIVVVAAAGNEGAGAPAHTSPWVTTVGGTTGDSWRGQVVLSGGGRLGGAMLSRRTVGPARVVLASRAAASGASVDDARVCAPGSLDAATVARAVVVCERGGISRVDKSRAVDLADGVAMVLLNRGRRDSVDADVHRVPTVHLAAGPARRLLRWIATHPDGRLRLRPRGLVQQPARVARFSGSGDAGIGLLKPDLVAPSTGVLAAVPSTSQPWDFATGTSAATARTAGVAAVLLGRGMRPSEVRSALVTTARTLAGSPVLRTGGGLLRPDAARRPGLAYRIGAGTYRAWLEGERTSLNTPSVLLTGGALTARRTITNVTGRRLYFSSSARGFRRDVAVSPAAVRLAPGESVTFRVRVSPRGAARLDDGYVVWRGASGTVTRIPVVIAR